MDTIFDFFSSGCFCGFGVLSENVPVCMKVMSVLGPSEAEKFLSSAVTVLVRAHLQVFF